MRSVLFVLTVLVTQCNVAAVISQKYYKNSTCANEDVFSLSNTTVVNGAKSRLHCLAICTELGCPIVVTGGQATPEQCLCVDRGGIPAGALDYCVNLSLDVYWQRAPSSSCTDVTDNTNSIDPRIKATLDSGLDVLCDIQTDSGGWLVIQRRINGQVNFHQDWESYKSGFGTLESDFWLGNAIIYSLTSQDNYELRVEFSANGSNYYAVYNRFSILEEEKFYALTLGSYTEGDEGDILSESNGTYFKTYDSPESEEGGGCDLSYTGAWWYTNCPQSNLNGLWNTNNSSRMFWSVFRVDSSEMKIRLVG